jgi:hypothetical protein
MTGTVAGDVARISERIIDCPAKVIVISFDCDREAAAMAHAIANTIPRCATLVSSGLDLYIIAIALPSHFR